MPEKSENWPESDDNWIRTLWNCGYSDEEIYEHFPHRTEMAVRQRRQRLGLLKDPGRFEISSTAPIELPKPAAHTLEAKPRPCMRCRTVYESTWAGDRFCPPCRVYAAKI